jgi:hypothetical protein
MKEIKVRVHSRQISYTYMKHSKEAPAIALRGVQGGQGEETDGEM